MAKPRLNQVVAVVSGKKAQAAEALTGVYHLFQKATLFEGLDRRFTPRNDSGENKPAERKKPQHTVKELYAKVEPALAELFDGVATQDWGNTQARADVVVDGKVLLSAAPVTFLLFLDKQLQDIRSFVEKLPLRDAAEDWAFQPESGYFATPLSGRLVTAKVQEPLVLYPATEQHPALAPAHRFALTRWPPPASPPAARPPIPSPPAPPGGSPARRPSPSGCRRTCRGRPS
jgi:hypothetical protein